MGRLIDCDKLCSDLLDRWSIADKEKDNTIRSLMADVVTPIVASQPPVDAVPVVRCKDCKHREFYGLYFLTCERHRMSVDADYYCADGIREDGNDD